MEHDIRYSLMTDISYLREWMGAPGVLEFFPMKTEKEIEDAIQCWISFCRFSSSLTATVQGVPVAIGTLFLMPYQKVSHHCLFKIIVDPKWQRKGIGASMVKNLKHLAKTYFRLEMLNIEVYEGNPLIEILARQGFYEVFRQPHFVKDEGAYKARIFMEAAL